MYDMTRYGSVEVSGNPQCPKQWVMCLLMFMYHLLLLDNLVIKCDASILPIDGRVVPFDPWHSEDHIVSP